MKSTVFMIDSRLGHLSLIFYVFAVLDEKISWKKLLAGLPVGICWSFFHAASENVMLSYALMSILALVFWTAAVSGIWKRGLVEAFFGCLHFRGLTGRCFCNGILGMQEPYFWKKQQPYVAGADTDTVRAAPYGILSFQHPAQENALWPPGPGLN